MAGKNEIARPDDGRIRVELEKSKMIGIDWPFKADKVVCIKKKDRSMWVVFYGDVRKYALNGVALIKSPRDSVTDSRHYNNKSIFPIIEFMLRLH